MDEKEYIEREAAIEEIESLSVTVTGLLCGKGVLAEYAKQYKDSITKILADAPAADVAPVVHGEWEWFEEWRPSTPDATRECEDCGWRCGKCKDALEDMVGGYWDNPEEKPKLNYCPSCGAIMDGKRKEADNG